MIHDVLNFVLTADGSKTVYNPAIGENYHSRNGALQESRHVFLNAGLQHYLAANQVNEVSILEVGFGTGLNFLLSADHAKTQGVKLDYMGIEAYPLSAEMIVQTGYGQYVSPGLWGQFISRYPSSLKQITTLDGALNLYVAPIPLMDFKSAIQFDVIYYDAFASANQPEMWTAEAISHTIRYLKPGGIFVTYAITGNLKRMLRTLGCSIEKVPGALGKREMLRATKLL